MNIKKIKPVSFLIGMLFAVLLCFGIAASVNAPALFLRSLSLQANGSIVGTNVTMTLTGTNNTFAVNPNGVPVINSVTAITTNLAFSNTLALRITNGIIVGTMAE